MSTDAAALGPDRARARFGVLCGRFGLMDHTDAELLASWRAGNKLAGEQLCRRHAPSIVRFFRNKVSTAVEDLVQQTLLALLEGQERITDPSKLRAYLFGIAHNVLRTHLRELSRGRQIDEGVSSLAELDPGPTTALARKREQRLLLLALRRLPIQHQVALELYYWEGLNTVEIAEILGLSDSAMRSRMVRARSLLEAELAQLAESDVELRSTVEKLDGWAAQIRERMR
jgi:RNA polymerase sigma-70 factor (ECF subfamily)